MNEELKIIIKAVTDEAKKNISEVKKELEGVKAEGKESGKQVNAALKGFAKGAAMAVTAIVALTAAMTNLGKSAQEINKGFSKLKSSFDASGASAKQATKYYKDLFGVLGDHDRTVETGQSLARITTNPSALGDYKNIMAGAVSKYGDGYNSEALAENISETIAAAQVTGDLERVLVEAGISADGFNATLQQIASTEEREILIRSTLNGVLGEAGKQYIAANQATITYNESQANLNIALASAAQYTLPLLTALNNLSTSLLTSLAPALETVSLYLTAFIQLISEAVQWVGGFFGTLGGSAEKSSGDMAGYKAAMQNYLSSLRNYFGGTNAGMDETLDNINAIKRATMGFDELNVVSKPSSSAAIGGGGAGGGGGIGSMPVAPNPADFGIGGGIDSAGYQKKLEEAKERIKAILTLVGLVGIGLLSWKIADFIEDLKTGVITTEQLKGKVASLGGALLIAAGAMALIASYSDAWVNGIDWANFFGIIGGIAAIVAGLYIMVNPLAAAIGLIIGLISMIVIGVKDLITNGYSLQGALMTIIGVAALLAGAIASPIPAIIAAVVGGIYILWNEFEGFRNFCLEVWDTISTFFTKTLPDAIKKGLQWIHANLLMPIANFYNKWIAPVVNKLIEMALKLVEMLVAVFVGLWNLLRQQVLVPIANAFKSLWEGIKEVFSPVVSFFSGVFTKAYNAIVKVFSKVGSFFVNLWGEVKAAFSSLGTVIGDAISSAVKTGINGIISMIEKTINTAISLINGAINAINLLPGVSVKKLTKLEMPRLATGGIVTSSIIANIGENGREAVLPLEHNTGWMDTLAEKISARGGTTPSRLVLMIDGKELGYATINSINDITRQTGTLQLNVI